MPSPMAKGFESAYPVSEIPITTDSWHSADEFCKLNLFRWESWLRAYPDPPIWDAIEATETTAVSSSTIRTSCQDVLTTYARVQVNRLRRDALRRGPILQLLYGWKFWGRDYQVVGPWVFQCPEGYIVKDISRTNRLGVIENYSYCEPEEKLKKIHVEVENAKKRERPIWEPAPGSTKWPRFGFGSESMKFTTGRIDSTKSMCFDVDNSVAYAV